MTRRIAVIGAGPIGIEAALRGLANSWQVDVYERETVGAHLLKWGHVRFFSPLRENVSPVLTQHLRSKPNADAFLTGREFVENVLRPVADGVLDGKIHEGSAVRSIGKRRLTKTELAAHPLRAERSFQLLVHTRGGGEEIREADAVIDASGVYGWPNWAGESGLPCPGERENSMAIVRHLPDIGGADKAHWSGKSVVVIGDGHSAATAVVWLGELAKKDPATKVNWIVPADRARPCVEVADDPLPERRRVVARANDIAESPPPGWTVHRKQALLALSAVPNGFQAVIGRGDQRATVKIQKILALTGYRPDPSLFEELQVEISPVTGGAAGLAKSLLGVTDCLAKIDVPAERLESGETNFFLAGHKSYGRLNTFLLRSGLEQLDLAFRRLGA